jgi:hypothetical protein
METPAACAKVSRDCQRGSDTVMYALARQTEAQGLWVAPRLNPHVSLSLMKALSSPALDSVLWQQTNTSWLDLSVRVVHVYSKRPHKDGVSPQVPMTGRSTRCQFTV